MIVADRAFADSGWPRAQRPAGRLRGRGGRARPVRPGAGAGRAPGPERAGWGIGDLERVEINEAFAAVPLAVMQELGLPRRHGQRRGRGHRPRPPDRRDGRGPDDAADPPRMKRDGLRRGMVTLCIGGGQGIALALEAL